MEWISVENRLPVENTDVLVYHQDREIVEVRYLKTIKGINFNMDPIISHGWYPGGSFGWHSHWQPLPEPPK